MNTEINKRKKANTRVLNLIVNWLNNFNYDQKLTAFKELKDGSFFVFLVKLILFQTKNNDFKEHATIKIDDINDRFDLINMVMVTEFSISSGFNLSQAIQGDEIELAKIALIILANGVSLENKEINESFEKLDKLHYETMEAFYLITESHKSKFPPISVCIYEEFIFMSSRYFGERSINSTPSRNPKHCHFLTSTPHHNTKNMSSSSGANYLLSPMGKVSIQSPREKHIRKKLEEDFYTERKKLEKELANKENLIYDLKYEITEHKAKLEEFSNQIENFKRQQIDFNRYKEQAYDYENLIVKHEELEKEKKYYEDKYRHMSDELDQIRSVKEKNASLEISLDKLTKEIGVLEKKEQSNLLELQRLRDCETELNSAIEKNKLKEEKILELLKNNSDLDSMRVSVNDQMKKMRVDFEEQIERLTGENAILQAEKNSIQGQLMALKEGTLIDFKNVNEEKTTLLARYENILSHNENLTILNKDFMHKIEYLEVNDKLLSNQNELYINKIAEKDLLIENMESEIKKFREESYSKMKETKQKNEELYQELIVLTNKLNMSEQQLLNLKDKCKLEENDYIQKTDKLVQEEQSLKKRLLELQSNIELQKSEYTMRINNLENNLKKVNLEVEILNSKLIEEQNEKEVSRYSSLSKINELNSQINQLNDKINTLESNLNSTKKCLKSSENLILNQKNEYECRIDSLNNNISSLNKRLAADREEYEYSIINLTTRLNEQDKKNKDLIIQINELNQTLNSANSEKNEVKFKYTECQKQLNFKIEHLNDEVERLNNQVAKAENNYLTLKNNSSQIQLNLENEIEDLNGKINELNTNWNASKDDLSKMQNNINNQVEEFNKTSDILNLNLRLAKEQYQKLNIESNNKLNEFEANIASLENQLFVASNQLSESKNELNSCKSELADLNLKNSDLNKENENLKNSINIWKNEYNLLKSVSNSSFEQLNNKINNLSLENEGLLSNLNQSNKDNQVLNEDLKKAKENLFESCEKNQKLQLELSDLENKFNEEVKVKNNQQDCWTEAKKKLNLEIESLNFEVETLNNQIKAATNEYSLLQVNFNENKSKLENEIDELKTNIDELNASLAIANNNIKVQQSEYELKVKELKNGLDTYKMEILTATEEKLALGNTIINHQNKINELNLFVENLNNQIKKSKVESDLLINDLTTSNENHNAATIKLNNKIEQLSEELSSTLANLTSLKDERNSKESEFILQIQFLEEAKESLQIELQHLKQAEIEFKNESNNKINSMELRIHDYELNIEKANSQILILSNQLIESEIIIEKIKNEFSFKEGELIEKNRIQVTEINNLNDNIKKLLSEKVQQQNDYTFKTCQLNENISSISNELEILRNSQSEYNSKIEQTSQQLDQVKQQNQSLASVIEQNKIEYTQNINILQKNLAEQNQNLQQIQNEYKTLVLEKSDLCQKINEYEMQLTQKNSELNKLESLLVNHKNFQEESVVLKKQLESILNNYELDKENKQNQIKIYQKKREEMNNEIEELKAKIQILEDKEHTLNATVKEKISDLNNMHILFEKEKEMFQEQNLKLFNEIQTLRKEKNEITVQWKLVKEFNQKFETHYEQKKKIFNDAQIECQELSKENTEMKKLCSRLETNINTMQEELGFMKEKIKTLTFENQQLRSHKDSLIKKMNETQIIDRFSVGGSLNSLNSQTNQIGKLQRVAVLSTPKTNIQNQHKFLDDSFHKFTSPSLGTNNGVTGVGYDLPEIIDDFSRRFSIDSVSRVSTSNQNNPSVNMPVFNRFNTISENEFEEPTIFQKSLHANEENALLAQRRLTQIIARNEQTKPHLKSSYALEELPNKSEKFFHKSSCKENMGINKVSAIKPQASLCKRKFDDGPTKSPNVLKQPLKREKSNLGNIKQTDC